MFSEVAEIALVAARLGQFQQLPKTRVILILNFTRPHAIAYTNCLNKLVSTVSGWKTTEMDRAINNLTKSGVKWGMNLVSCSSENHYVLQNVYSFQMAHLI